MSGMNDKIKGLGVVLKANLDKALVGLMAVFLVVTAILQFGETQTAEYIPAPPQPTSPTSAIDREKPEYKLVMALDDRLPPFEQAESHVLVDFNMFDPKSAKSDEEAEQECDKLIGEGRTALDAGDLSKAEQLAKAALAKLPSHKGAKDLLTAIAAKKAAAAAAAPATPPGGPKPPRPAPK